jgi:hypothetical protein
MAQAEDLGIGILIEDSQNNGHSDNDVIAPSRKNDEGVALEARLHDLERRCDGLGTGWVEGRPVRRHMGLHLAAQLGISVRLTFHSRN